MQPEILRSAQRDVSGRQARDGEWVLAGFSPPGGPAHLTAHCENASSPYALAEREMAQETTDRVAELRNAVADESQRRGGRDDDRSDKAENESGR